MTFRLSIFILALAFSTVRAQDTFSIVAIDTVTGEVGSAGASCLQKNIFNPLGCAIITDVHPGIGAIHTQALWNSNNQAEAGGQMEDGATPQAILDYVTANDADNRPAIRQYGVVSLTHVPHAAAFTGDSCQDYKGHIVGPYYSIQGNILSGRNILEQMESNFLNTSGPLADRLMAAIQGANVRGADTRCYDSGTSSLSSFLRVAQKTDEFEAITLDIIIPQVKKGVEPIDSLQHSYDQWKLLHAFVEEQNAAGPIHVSAKGTGAIRVRGLASTENATFDLCAVDGRRIVRSVLSHGMSEIVLQNSLRSGIYLYRLLTDGGRLATGKLLIVQ